MATRFYHRNSADIPAPVSPALDASWEVTAGSPVRRFMTTTTGTTTTPGGALTPNGTNPNDLAIAQWISAPLAAQVISGTVKGQALCNQTNALIQARAQLLVKVVSNDGSVVRGTLLAHSTAAYSHGYNTTNRNITFPLGGATSLTPLRCAAGDRLVVEWGSRVHSTRTDANGVVVNLRNDPAYASDLPEDETDTSTSKNSWIEFSQNLKFYMPVVKPIHLDLGVGVF